MSKILKAAALDLDVLGSTGLRQYGGVLNEEFLARLRGTQAVRVYREMADNSSTVGAVLYSISMLIRQAKWRIEPAGDSPEAKEQAEFVDSCIQDMSHTLQDLVSEALSMLPYGWALLETVYKLRRGPDSTDPKFRSKHEDGRVGWRKFSLRSQDTLDHWELDEEDNGLRAMWQMDPYAVRAGVMRIPIEKAVLFRTSQHKGNPEGRSILRTSVIPYFFLKRMEEIEAVGVERDMTGLLTMEVPLQLLHPGASDAEKAQRRALEEMLSALKRDQREFAMVPQEVDSDNKPTGYKLKLLATGGRRQIDTDAIINRYMRNITMAMLADFLMLGSQSVGSFALSSDKTRLFGYALGAIMDSIADVITRFAIPRLMDLNGVPSKLWPSLVHGDIETPPLADVAQYITALATAGMLRPNRPLESKLLEIGNLPQPPEDAGDFPLPGEDQLAAAWAEAQREARAAKPDAPAEAPAESQPRVSREGAAG